jgi:hypothetical protein
MNLPLEIRRTDNRNKHLFCPTCQASPPIAQAWVFLYQITSYLSVLAEDLINAETERGLYPPRLSVEMLLTLLNQDLLNYQSVGNKVVGLYFSLLAVCA